MPIKQFKYWKEKLLKDQFLKNFTVVFTGKFFVLISSFLLTPIVTRLYAPEAYGVFALFTAFCTNLALVSMFSYPRALVLPKKENHFYNLVIGSLLMALLVTAISSFLILIFHSFLETYFEIDNIWFFVLVPIGTLTYAMITIMSNWNVRRGNFKLSTGLEAGGVLGIRLFNIGQGLILTNNIHGLYYGDLLGKVIAALINFRATFYRERNNLIQSFDRRILRKLLYQYRQYPLYFFPSIWSSMLANQLPLLAFSHYFSNHYLGAYSLTVNVLSQPVFLFANSLSPVILKELTVSDSIVHHQGVVKRTFSKLFFINVIPFVLLGVFAESYLPILLSEKWKLAGVLVKYLVPVFFMQLMTYPYSTLYQVKKKEKVKFYLDIIPLMSNVIILFFGVESGDFLLTIQLLSISNAAILLIHLVYLFNLIKLNIFNHLVKFVGAFAVVYYALLEIIELV